MHKEFKILDTSEDQTFIYVKHFDQSFHFGNIYISDTEASRYSASLLNVISTEDNDIDFHKIDSLEGVYIANTYNHEFILKKTSE